ncbi:MAG: hypothetical protein ACRCYD_01880 [Plesiomonas sp.]
MANKNPKNQFSKEHQPGKRSEGYRTRLLKALKAFGLSEEEFLEDYIRKAMSSDSLGGVNEILFRLSPPPKAVLPTVEFEYPREASPVEKIDFVVESVARGDIPADVGSTIVNMIKASIDAREITEVLERIEKLEKMLAGGGNGQEAGS